MFDCSSEGIRFLCQGTASDVIISRREGVKSMRFGLESSRDTSEWEKSTKKKIKMGEMLQKTRLPSLGMSALATAYYS